MISIMGNSIKSSFFYHTTFRILYAVHQYKGIKVGGLDL